MINAATLVSPSLCIRVSCGALTVVRLEGELDPACTDLVAAAARLIPGHAALVTVDLRGLTCVAGTGVDTFAAVKILRGVLTANASADGERVYGFLGIGTWLPRPRSAVTRPPDVLVEADRHVIGSVRGPPPIRLG